MADEQSDLLAVLRDVAAGQQKIDKFGAISTFVSSVVIAGVAGWFTHEFDQQQINVNELTILEKFIPHLAAGTESEQQAAIIELSALGDTKVAVQLAQLYSEPGTVAGILNISKNGTVEQQAIANSAIGSIGGDLPVQALNIVKFYEGPFQARALDAGRLVDYRIRNIELPERSGGAQGRRNDRRLGDGVSRTRSASCRGETCGIHPELDQHERSPESRAH